jgi:hypothetical protein
VTSPALERVVATIDGAKLVPLTDSIRVDSEELVDLIAQARAEAPWAVPALTRLEQLVESGRSVPLTSEVRIERRKALSLLEQAREAGEIPPGFASSQKRKRLPLLSKLRRRSALAQEETQQSARE